MPNDISEELAVTKNDIKHLESDMTEIKSGIKEINENFNKHLNQMYAQMDAWQANFVSKELLEEKLKYQNERIDRLEEDKASRKTLAPHWIATTLAAISLAFTIFVYAWSSHNK